MLPTEHNRIWGGSVRTYKQLPCERVIATITGIIGKDSPNVSILFLNNLKPTDELSNVLKRPLFRDFMGSKIRCPLIKKVSISAQLVAMTTKPNKGI